MIYLRNINTEEKMLKLENICFSAEGENGTKEILKNINLELDNGFAVITGPNGCGKSTLA